MNRNVKIARELVKLAKSLVAENVSLFENDKKAIIDKCHDKDCTCTFKETTNQLQAFITLDMSHDYEKFTIVEEIDDNGTLAYGVEGDGVSQEYGLHGGKINSLDDALKCIFEGDDEEEADNGLQLYEILSKFCNKLMKKCKYLTNADPFFDTDNYNSWDDTYTIRLTDDDISKNGSSYITYEITLSLSEGCLLVRNQITKNGQSTQYKQLYKGKWDTFESPEVMSDMLDTCAYRINQLHKSEKKS